MTDEGDQMQQVAEPTTREAKLERMTAAGYKLARVPEFPAEPTDCSMRRDRYFITRRKPALSTSKDRMGWRGQDIHPQMPNK